MSDKPRCPECDQLSIADGGTCSPLRCSAWKVVGKWTKPVGVNGGKRLIRVLTGVVEANKDD